jgi:hypothetical protein
LSSAATPLIVALCLLVSILLTIAGLRVALRGVWTWWAAPAVLLAELLAGGVFILLILNPYAYLHPFGPYSTWLTAHSVLETFRPRPLLDPYLWAWKANARTLFIAAPGIIGLTTATYLYFLVLPLVKTYSAMVAALFFVSLLTAAVVHLLLAQGTLPQADHVRDHFRLMRRLLFARFTRLSIGALVALSLPAIQRVLEIPDTDGRQLRGMIMMGFIFTGIYWASRQDAALETQERQRLERRRQTGKTAKSTEGVTTI